MPNKKLTCLVLFLVALGPVSAVADDDHHGFGGRREPIIFSADANVGLTQAFITGDNFGRRTGTVRFGAASATVASWSPTVVVIDLPSGTEAGSYLLTLATASGE